MTSLLPPGTTSTVDAERVLVIAPHYDDEVLGCGGLLAQMVSAGADVRVLFLTDSGATASPAEDRAAHSRERWEEAAAARAVLGLTEAESLDLPDGELAQHLGEAGDGIARALERLRPNVVLVPSPLEVTTDHRAAFAALYRVLSPVRESAPSGLDAALLARLTVLAYEVNRPLFPTLLVDVSAQMARIEAALACYVSQEQRHGYLRSRLGLSRYRTLSLGPEVEAAEGYARLEATDFTTRSLTQLIRHLGGEPERLEITTGPRMSIVVRTKDRPALLAEALASLAASTYRNVEVVLVNDGGAPPLVPVGFPWPVVHVDLPENRGRARAAQAGVEAASGDFVSFLDDDDLLAPEHLATLAGLVSAAGVRVAYTDAAVGVYELGPEGGWNNIERRLPYSRDFDRDLLLVDNYIPFHTLAIERELFERVGAFDDSLPFFEDWDFLIRLAAETPFHHLPQVTCEYRHFRGAGHHILGASAQSRADFLAMKVKVLAKHSGALAPTVLATVIDRLRSEIVALGEDRHGARRELKARDSQLAELRREQGQLASEHYRLNGELVAAKGDAFRLVAELQAGSEEISRLHREEQRLTADAQRLEAALTTQNEQVARLYSELAPLYGEVKRLSSQLQAMESTRAWRLHQWWQRRKSRGTARG